MPQRKKSPAQKRTRKASAKAGRKAKGSAKRRKGPARRTASPQLPRSKQAPTPEGGRPPIEWTPEGFNAFQRLVQVGNTIEDTAAILAVSKRWLEQQVAENEVVRDAYHKARAERRSSLRTWQYQRAKAGSNTMLVWLGKQELGQRDYKAVEHTGPEGGPIPFSRPDLAPLLSERIRAFQRAQQAKAAAGDDPEASAE